MTQTMTIQTEYGDVEIETVECDSCGNTIGKDDAREFTLGDREGYACDHCVDEGPINFPDKYGSLDMGESDTGGFLEFLLWGPVAIPLVMIFAPFENDRSESLLGAMWVAWAIAIYTLLAGAVLLFLL